MKSRVRSQDTFVLAPRARSFRVEIYCVILRRRQLSVECRLLVSIERTRNHEENLRGKTNIHQPERGRWRGVGEFIGDQRLVAGLRSTIRAFYRRMKKEFVKL